MVIDCEVFFLKIFQNHQWFLADFFDNCYTKCCKFRIKIFIFLTLNKLYSSRGFAFCFYKEYFRCVTLWSTISLAWFGVVDKLPFPLHPSVSFVTLAQFHFGSHTCGFRPASLLRFFKIWLLASKVNVKLSKQLKFTVKGFETVGKGFSFLLEKFGCGCTQRRRRQRNKGEQIFDLFCL